MDKEQQISDLKRQLEYHDNLYYTHDDPDISDEEYNAIKDEYLLLSGLDEYDYIPGELLSSLTRVTHTYPIRSLSKVNDYDTLKNEMRRLFPFVIQPKLDGLTLVGYGPMTMATRGNGEEGENVVDTAMKVENLKEIATNVAFLGHPVRMEVFMKKSVFNVINEEKIANGEEPFKNPRNAAAGMLRQKDANKVKGLTYMAYNMVGSKMTETDQIYSLKESGFITVPYVEFGAKGITAYEHAEGQVYGELSNMLDNTMEGILDAAIEYVKNFDRDSLDYEIDGLVIKSNEYGSLEMYGETGHHPKNAVAYKFPAEGKWTKIKDVTWQVGRTGKITPVAELVPVDIGGSTIARVTLHNAAIMEALGLSEWCEVFVIKANDVIPAIIQVRRDPNKPVSIFLEPSHCPECDEHTRKENDQLFCKNPRCHAKNVNTLVHLAKRDALDIEGLSIETAEKLFSQKLVEKPFDVFNLTVEDLIKVEGFGQKSAEKLYKNIQAARKPELKKFLYAAGLPLVGRTASADIAKEFGSWENIYAAGEDLSLTDRLRAIEGIGQGTVDAVLNYGHLWTSLAEYITSKATVVKTTTVPGKVLSIVVTGSFEEDGKKVSRDEIKAMITDAGHKSPGSVSKKTDYVLVGADAGGKEDEAKKLGLTIINSIDELRDIL
jgi:DNA ligase (NAD+)